jgi:hypothetical protein
MDLLEGIPASYLVIHTAELPPERRVDYDAFLGRAVAAGRLRFINRFDSQDDLYAIVKTEPQAKSEAPLPFNSEAETWSNLIKKDPVNLLGEFRSWSQTVCRFSIASFAELPRYKEFVPDVEFIARNVFVGAEDSRSILEANLRQFAREWVQRPKFEAVYKAMSNDRFVDALLNNAGITLDPVERTAYVDKLNRGELKRADVLVDLVNREEFIGQQDARSLLLLHYFGYLRRNPDDPPDNNWDGFNYWLEATKTSGDTGRLARIFMASFEYEKLQRKAAAEKN